MPTDSFEKIIVEAARRYGFRAKKDDEPIEEYRKAVNRHLCVVYSEEAMADQNFTEMEI